MKITLPWPPSINGGYWTPFVQPRKVKGRTRYVVRQILSKKGRDYREKVAVALMGSGIQTTDARLAVTITLHPATTRSFDLDNFNKSVLDSLEHVGVFGNDSQIDDLRIIRGEKRPGGAAVVEIRELTEGAAK